MAELPLMSQTLAARASRIPGEGAIETLSRALTLESQGVDMIHLEIGQPDFSTPEHIVEAGVTSMRDGRTGYGPAPGTPELRTAVAEEITASRGFAVDSANVIIAPGGKPVVFFTILALIETGDEVIVPDPGFPIYAGMTRFVGGVPVSLPLRAENNFKIDLDRLRTLITERTKLLILNSPSNPTGGVISSIELEAIAKIAQAHNLWVLSDEIYSRLYYGDQPPPSIAALPGMAERTILLDGFSKTYAMTGWRLGYGIYPRPLLTPVTNMSINSHTCVPLFVQDAGVAALQGSQESVTKMRDEYRARRDLVVNGLNAISGVTCPLPKGAFYAMPDISGLGVENARAFSERLLEAGVATLPGTDFGPHGEGYLRLSYATRRDRLAEALKRMATVCQTLEPHSSLQID